MTTNSDGTLSVLINAAGSSVTNGFGFDDLVANEFELGSDSIGLQGQEALINAIADVIGVERGWVVGAAVRIQGDGQAVQLRGQRL